MKKWSEIEKTINTMEESDQIKCIRKYNNINLIESIVNPSANVQLAAIESQPSSITLIKDVSDEVKIEAIKRTNGRVIRYITDATEDMRLLALAHGDSHTIKFIENPSFNEQLFAINNNPCAISDIENPSIALQLTAVNMHPSAIYSIENPEECVQLAAVQKNGLVISAISKPSAKVKTAAVIQNARAIIHISKPSIKLQKIAIQDESMSVSGILRYIDKPCEDVIRTAFAKDEKNSLHNLVYSRRNDLPELLKNWHKTIENINEIPVTIYARYDVKIMQYTINNETYVIGLREGDGNNINSVLYTVGCQKDMTATTFLGRIHHMDDDDDLCYRDLLQDEKYAHRKMYIEIIRYAQNKYEDFEDDDDYYETEGAECNWFDTTATDPDREKYLVEYRKYNQDKIQKNIIRK